MRMTTIYLVRHGSTEWNETKRAQGLADIGLSEEGRRQAKAAAEKLADLHIDAVFASDLERAVDTAQAIAAPRGLEVQTDPAFREIDQGEWTGLPIAEIEERWPDLWGGARHYTRRPGGEAPHEVSARALEGLRRIVEAYPEGTVVVVSHGGPLRWLSAAAMGWDERESARLRGVSNGGILSLEASPNGRALALEDLKRYDGASVSMDDPNA